MLLAVKSRNQRHLCGAKKYRITTVGKNSKNSNELNNIRKRVKYGNLVHFIICFSPLPCAVELTPWGDI